MLSCDTIADLPFSNRKIHCFFDISAQVLLDDSTNCLLHLRTGAQETAARDFDGRTGFLQRHELPELRCVAQSNRTFVIPTLAVLLPAETSGRLVVFVPKVSLHPWGNYDLATLIVNGSVGQVRVERDAVLGRPALDATAQAASIDQDMTVSTQRATPALPCLTEECLTLKVLVKLVGHLHFDVLKDSS